MVAWRLAQSALRWLVSEISGDMLNFTAEMYAAHVYGIEQLAYDRDHRHAQLQGSCVYLKSIVSDLTPRHLSLNLEFSALSTVCA